MGNSRSWDLLKSRLNCNLGLMWKDQSQTRRSCLFIISQTSPSGSPTSLVLPLPHQSEVDWTATCRRRGLLPVIVDRNCLPPEPHCPRWGTRASAADSGQRGSCGTQSRATIFFSSISRLAFPHQSEVTVQSSESQSQRFFPQFLLHHGRESVHGSYFWKPAPTRIWELHFTPDQTRYKLIPMPDPHPKEN